MRRSFATIWWLARTDVDSTDEVARAGHDDERTAPLDVPHLGEVGQEVVLDRRRRSEAQPLLRVDHRDDAGGRVDGDQPAMVEDGHPIGETLGFLHQVRDEEDGHAAIADRLDQVPCFPTRLRVEAGRELVEDRDPRPADERERDGQALLLATGEIAVGGVALVLEREAFDEFAGIGRSLVEGRVEIERLADRQSDPAARSPGAGRRRGCGAVAGRGEDRGPGR